MLVFALAAATLFLVYEHRPKLMLSAAALGRGMTSMGGGSGNGGGSGGGGGLDEYEAYEQDGGGWGSRGGGSSSSSAWGKRRGGRPHGALTEMVMESEIGVGAQDAYRLLEDDGAGDADGYEDDEDRRLGAQREEEWRGQGGGGAGSARRSV